jgi:hypothetical protein
LCRKARFENQVIEARTCVGLPLNFKQPNRFSLGFGPKALLFSGLGILKVKGVAPFEQPKPLFHGISAYRGRELHRYSVPSAF